MYATRANTPNASRIRNLVLFIKRDQIQVETRRPYADVLIERMAADLPASFRDLFAEESLLVPVPGAGLTRPKTVWPALSLCQALQRSGLGTSVRPLLRRVHAVPKSAGSQSRPTLNEHYRSLAVQGTLRRPGRLVLVDDVVTSGTTLMAGGRRLAEAFPEDTIVAFALARVHSTGEPPRLAELLIERIVVHGERCRRAPLLDPHGG